MDLLLILAAVFGVLFTLGLFCCLVMASHCDDAMGYDDYKEDDIHE